MDLTEKKLSSETVYDGKILKLDVDDVELPDGRKAKRECIRHSGGAAVLCVVDGRVLLVRQYRYLYGKAILEIPAGKIERGEDPALAAKRELEEETGYAADVVPLLDIYPTPGYTDEIIHIYLAVDCKESLKNPDDGEFVETYSYELSEVADMIERGEICDAKTVAAVYKYLIMQK